MIFLPFGEGGLENMPEGIGGPTWTSKRSNVIGRA
jgi:hypothetical protein